MSQWETEEFMEKHKESWFTARELSELLGISIGSCMDNLRRMRTHRNVKTRERKGDYHHTNEYSHKSLQNNGTSHSTESPEFSKQITPNGFDSSLGASSTKHQKPMENAHVNYKRLLNEVD